MIIDETEGNPGLGLCKEVVGLDEEERKEREDLIQIHKNNENEEGTGTGEKVLEEKEDTPGAASGEASSSGNNSETD